MAIKINHPGVAHARELIKSGHVSHGSFDESKVSRTKANAHAFLAIDDSAPDDTEAHWKYPVVDPDGKVNVKALGTAAGYAGKNGAHDIAIAAHRLSQQAQAADGDALSDLDDDDQTLAAVGDDQDDLSALDDGDYAMAEGEFDIDHDFDIDDIDPDDPDFPELDDEDLLAGPTPCAGSPACEKTMATGTTPASGVEGAGEKTVALSKRISLRSGIAFGPDVKVDRENHAIRNVSIMQRGPAKGHGFLIDSTMLNQIFDQMRGGGAGGVPMRFKHPQQQLPDGTQVPLDAIGTHVGKVIPRNLDQGSGQIRGDIEFGAHARKVPMMGDVESYLMDLADSDPSAFGLSVVFAPDEFDSAPDGTPIGRSARTEACDLTADPAANPAGLL